MGASRQPSIAISYKLFGGLRPPYKLLVVSRKHNQKQLIKKQKQLAPTTNQPLTTNHSPLSTNQK
ncbi:hypothetical protein OSCI_3500012 [Kamptonema sp. PCC 6506]|nr:hypothetical protein OSCI_3500012 [Kamptonema sp. PCC 6506]